MKHWLFKRGNPPPKHKEGCECVRCTHIPWNKGVKGVVKQSKETIEKRREKLLGHRPFRLKNPNSEEIRRRKQNYYTLKRVAKKKNALGSHSFDEWIKLKEHYGNMCLCCKRTEPEVTLTQDHIVPLSRGGSDYIYNIQPLCRSCNSRKSIKTISFLPTGSLFKVRELNL